MNRRGFIAGGTAAAAVIAMPMAALPTLVEAAPAAEQTVFMSWLGFCRTIREGLRNRGFHGAIVEDFSYIRIAPDGKETDIWGVRIIEPVSGAREALVWTSDDFCNTSFLGKMHSARWQAQNVGRMAEGMMRIKAWEREAMFEAIPHYWGA